MAQLSQTSHISLSQLQAKETAQLTICDCPYYTHTNAFTYGNIHFELDNIQTGMQTGQLDG